MMLPETLPRMLAGMFPKSFQRHGSEMFSWKDEPATRNYAGMFSWNYRWYPKQQTQSFSRAPVSTVKPSWHLAVTTS